MLTKLGLADKYEGQVEISGEDFNVEAMDDGPKPFRAFLDVGLTRTTTGNRVFAAMKGAVDGGIDIPHGYVCACMCACVCVCVCVCVCACACVCMCMCMHVCIYAYSVNSIGTYLKLSSWKITDIHPPPILWNCMGE